MSANIGTQRRAQKKHASTQQATVNEDKRLKAAIKKFGKSLSLLLLDAWLIFVLYLCVIGVQPLNDIEEVNMFKDDNSVVHFRRPTGK